MAPTSQYPEYVVSVTSRFAWEATATRIIETLTSRGMTIFADIDQTQFAAKVGAELRSTRLILFGNPKAGTPVMAANPHAALELPLKILLWQDEEGVVHVDYLDPATLLGKGYGIDSALTSVFAPLPDLLRRAAQGN